jgi:hypothetical protein
MIDPQSSRDKVQSAADAMQELALIDALEGAFFLLFVQAGGSVRTLATGLNVLRPESIARDLCQCEVAVDRIEARLEHTASKEELDIEFTGTSALCTVADKPASLLKQLLESIRGLLSRAPILVTAEMQSANL